MEKELTGRDYFRAETDRFIDSIQKKIAARKMINFALGVLYNADEMGEGDIKRAHCLRTAALDLMLDQMIEIGKIEYRIPQRQPSF